MTQSIIRTPEVSTPQYITRDTNAARADPVGGTVGTPWKRARAEHIGLYKTECVREGSPFRTGPIRTLTDLENITSAWVAWYNVRRLMHRLGRRPPAEAEAEYYVDESRVASGRLVSAQWCVMTRDSCERL